MSRNDIKIWEKISRLNNKETYWSDIRELTKNISSDKLLSRWQCLAECYYYEQLKGE